jgi:hypothetical protein
VRNIAGETFAETFAYYGKFNSTIAVAPIFLLAAVSNVQAGEEPMVTISYRYSKKGNGKLKPIQFNINITEGWTQIETEIRYRINGNGDLSLTRSVMKRRLKIFADFFFSKKCRENFPFMLDYRNVYLVFDSMRILLQKGLQ